AAHEGGHCPWRPAAGGTESGTIMGTADHIALQQAAGKPLDQCSGIGAFGRVVSRAGGPANDLATQWGVERIVQQGLQPAVTTQGAGAASYPLPRRLSPRTGCGPLRESRCCSCRGAGTSTYSGASYPRR